MPVHVPGFKCTRPLNLSPQIYAALSEAKEDRDRMKEEIKKDVIKVRKKLNNVDSFLRIEVTQMFQSGERESEGLRYALRDMEEKQKVVNGELKSVLTDVQDKQNAMTTEMESLKDGWLSR